MNSGPSSNEFDRMRADLQERGLLDEHFNLTIGGLEFCDQLTVRFRKYVAELDRGGRRIRWTYP
jgi:hypothetical protein